MDAKFEANEAEHFCPCCRVPLWPCQLCGKLVASEGKDTRRISARQDYSGRQDAVYTAWGQLVFCSPAHLAEWREKTHHPLPTIEEIGGSDPDCTGGLASDEPEAPTEQQRPRKRTVAQRIQQLLDESDDPAAMRAHLDALANEDEEPDAPTEQEANE
jgi:hypothetical protein